MKLITFLLFAACLHVSATGFSQITLKATNAPLSKLMKAIEQQSGYRFLYFDADLKAGKNVSIHAQNISLTEALQRCFEHQPLTYTIVDKTIVVKPRPVTTGNTLPAAVTQEPQLPPLIDVKGRVVDEEGKPVVGASVQVKGDKSKGVSTDAKGYFELKRVDENAVLLVSGVNIESIEVHSSGFTSEETKLIIAKTKIAQEQDVTVKTNYWETQQRLNPGNITKVTVREIERQPVSNPIATLQGRVPGLEVTQATGVPGGNFKVRIRGMNSIDNGNDPLYVIDGVPYISTSMSFIETSGSILGNPDPSQGHGSSPLNSIDPANIESIEVLKDADATAIYGSRGANGVILITTKRGKTGKMRTDINFYTGGGKYIERMDVLNLREYLDMRKEAFINDNTAPSISTARDLLVWDTTRSTNWQKELLGHIAKYLDAQISFSGGSEYTQFLFGGGYHRETTVFPGDNSDQRGSAHISLTNTTPNKKMKTFISVNYSGNLTNLLSQDLTGRALFLPPNAPQLYLDNGDLNWDGWNTSGALDNPVAYLKRKYRANTHMLIGNASIGYSLLHELELKLNLGYTHTTMDAYTLVPISSLAPSTTAFNTTIFSNSKFYNWNVEPQVNWRSGLGKGKLEVLAGIQFLNQLREGLAQTATGFSSEMLMENLSSASDILFGTNYYAQYRYNATFGRINYNLENKYIINMTARRDGSSRFGPGKQFANFGAVGVAWIFSNEKFTEKTLPFLSNGKLRVSYGISGNDQLVDYQYLDTYISSGGSYMGIIGLAPSRLNNPLFAWETNKKFETGIELGFFDERIGTSFSYYYHRSSNQLIAEPLPAFVGFTSIQDNFPAIVQNTGIEIELTATNVKRKNISWNTSFNISIPRNKLVAFPGIESIPAYANAYTIGMPLNIVKSFRFTGIDAATGLYQYEDYNKDGKINAEDRQLSLFIGQKFYGGIGNNIQYRNFQIDILFQFVNQFGRNYAYNALAPGNLSNQPDFVLGRWQKAEDNTDIQRFQSSAISTEYNNMKFSDLVICDASFIRLKNLSFSYSLLSSWQKRIHVSSTKLFIRAQNLFIISKYKGLDPETQLNLLPPLKVIVAGINLTF